MRTTVAVLDGIRARYELAATRTPIRQNIDILRFEVMALLCTDEHMVSALLCFHRVRVG